MKILINQKSYKYISDNSNEVGADTAFFCTSSNEEYLNDAKNNGAATIVTPAVFLSLVDLSGVSIVGITGTNGKTTTAAAMYSFLLDLGERVALQGTRGFFINDDRIAEKSLTTPPLLETFHHLMLAKKSGCSFFIMEVSSHAISQKRIESLSFDLKIYTNISQDHLDYHKSFDAYKKAKESFFNDDCKKLINKDAKKIVFNTKNAYTYALDAPSTFNILAFSLNDGVTAMVKHLGKESDFKSPMVGFFNVYNLLAAISAVKLITKYSMQEICDVVQEFAGVSGRMEIISDRPLVIVDFAHTPDGMQKVMDSLKDKDIVVVFGAGGDRDKSKRAMMGRVANRFAKKIYLTNDNPRSEDPMEIINSIYEAIEKKDNVIVNADRKESIENAINELVDGEILLILGKGDEEYQEIRGENIPFDDRIIDKEAIKVKFNR